VSKRDKATKSEAHDDARYVVGIDLGTTHCALAFADASVEKARTEVMPTAQLVSQAAVEERELLPSFLYFAHASEGAMALPWASTREPAA